MEKSKEDLECFAKIFEINPLLMSVSHIEDNRIIKINPAFTKLMGYKKEEAINKTFEELDLFQDFDKFNKIKTNLLKGKKIKDKELILKNKRGELLYVEFSMEIIKEEEKEILIVMNDKTEKIKLIKDMGKKYQKIKNIIEGTKLGTWELNIKTGEIDLNNQFLKKIGYNPDQIKINNIETLDKFIHPRDLEKTNELLKKYIKGKTEYYSCEIRMKHRSGKWIWVRITGRVIEKDEDKIPIKILGTQEDISLIKEAEENLREKEKRYLLALNGTEAGLWDFNILKDELYISPMWKKIVGYEDDEIENTFEAIKKLCHPDDMEKFGKEIDKYFKGNLKKYETNYRLKHKDGSWRWIFTRASIIKNEEGMPYRWIGTNIDITKDIEKSIELEMFFSVSLDLLCIADLKGNFIKTNKAWEDTLGYKVEELKSRNFLDLVHPDDKKATIEKMEILESGENVSRFVNRYVNADGEYRYIEWRSTAYNDLIYGSARDITKRVKYEEKILNISNKDALTKAYNRRYIYARAREIIKSYKKTEQLFSIAIIDIDHFKKVNDNYGHLVGDFVLKEFSKTIEENLRPTDILGRYGGEEFIVILENTNKEHSHLAIERILKVIRNKNFICDENKIKITFSAGIANCKEVEVEELVIDRLIELADKRMYQAKREGRNKIIS